MKALDEGIDALLGNDPKLRAWVESFLNSDEMQMFAKMQESALEEESAMEKPGVDPARLQEAGRGAAISLVMNAIIIVVTKEMGVHGFTCAAKCLKEGMGSLAAVLLPDTLFNGLDAKGPF